jgi:hypothetical protein
MTTFEFKWLVYMTLTGHRGPRKAHHGNINWYTQRGSVAWAVDVTYINGVMGIVATFYVNL